MAGGQPGGASAGDRATTHPSSRSAGQDSVVNEPLHHIAVCVCTLSGQSFWPICSSALNDKRPTVSSATRSWSRTTTSSGQVSRLWPLSAPGNRFTSTTTRSPRETSRSRGTRRRQRCRRFCGTSSTMTRSRATVGCCGCIRRRASIPPPSYSGQHSGVRLDAAGLGAARSVLRTTPISDGNAALLEPDAHRERVDCTNRLRRWATAVQS